MRNDVPSVPKTALDLRVRIPVVQLAILIAGFSLLRFVLLMKFGPSHAPWGDLLRAFAVGFHLDLFVGIVLTAPLLFWLTIIPSRWPEARWHQVFLRAALFAAWT